MSIPASPFTCLRAVWVYKSFWFTSYLEGTGPKSGAGLRFFAQQRLTVKGCLKKTHFNQME